MRDLFLKTTDKQDIAEVLEPFFSEFQPTLENYFEVVDSFIVDYIGRLPLVINHDDPENEYVEVWSDKVYFNVRLVDETITLFDGFEDIAPELPTRTFAGSRNSN